MGDDKTLIKITCLGRNKCPHVKSPLESFICGIRKDIDWSKDYDFTFYLNLFSVITCFRQMKRLGKARNKAKLNSLSAIILYQIGQSHKN